MRCAKCDGETKVIDSRPQAYGTGIRRRRKCLECSSRFSTIEIAVNDIHAESKLEKQIEILQTTSNNITAMLETLGYKLKDAKDEMPKL